jgi:ankyrin repeat protein
VNRKDLNGRIALFYGAEFRRYGIAKLLIEHGADVDVPGFIGRIPLSFAAESDDEDTVKLLFDKGADINS